MKGPVGQLHGRNFDLMKDTTVKMQYTGCQSMRKQLSEPECRHPTLGSCRIAAGKAAAVAVATAACVYSVKQTECMD